MKNKLGQYNLQDAWWDESDGILLCIDRIPGHRGSATYVLIFTSE